MPEKKAVPEFKTEEEELAFWDEHEPEEFDDGSADELITSDDPLERTEEFLRNEAAVPGLDACIIADLGDALCLLDEWAVKEKARRAYRSRPISPQGR